MERIYTLSHLNKKARSFVEVMLVLGGLALVDGYQNPRNVLTLPDLAQVPKGSITQDMLSTCFFHGHSLYV